MPSDNFHIAEYQYAIRRAGKAFAWVYCGLALLAALLGDVWPGSAPGTSKLVHAGFGLLCAGMAIALTPGMLTGLRWHAVAATIVGMLMAVVMLAWGIRMIVEFPGAFEGPYRRKENKYLGIFVPFIFVVATVVLTWRAAFQRWRPQPEDLLADADHDLAAEITRSGIPGIDPDYWPPAIRVLIIVGALVALTGLGLFALELLGLGRRDD